MKKVGTLVEFLSERVLDNTIGSLWLAPQTVAFVIDRSMLDGEAHKNTVRMIKRRLPDIKIELFPFDKERRESIGQVLGVLWERHQNCVFDLAGGSELVLIPAFSFALKNNVPMLHIDSERGVCTNISRCEQLAEDFAMPQLSLEDFLAGNGAHLAGYGHLTPGRDSYGIILNLSRLILDYPSHWKEQCLYIQMAAARSSDLRVSCEARLLTVTHHEVNADPQFLRKIAETGAIFDLHADANSVSFVFKDEGMRRILCDSGTWLELLLYISAEASGRFSDIRLSARIGWGGEDDASRPYNEIDLVACAGIVPIFLSCKTGMPSNDDLNQIYVYAKKFGGYTARAAIATSREIGPGMSGLVARAQELGTVLIDRGDIVGGRLVERLTEML